MKVKILTAVCGRPEVDDPWMSITLKGSRALRPGDPETFGWTITISLGAQGAS